MAMAFNMETQLDAHCSAQSPRRQLPWGAEGRMTLTSEIGVQRCRRTLPLVLCTARAGYYRAGYYRAPEYRQSQRSFNRVCKQHHHPRSFNTVTCTLCNCV
jgi:hypothetical protein